MANSVGLQDGKTLDARNIRYTRKYLVKFESTAANSSRSGEFIERMKAAYFQTGLGIALDIWAKVNKGEMHC